ncbi:hypothetical protein Patl1_00759 [Pistacia atlantica]|uniref:Uncharacterized protein n=1 Tax=Pistacia atlantica TaxID=434234 RepID=A0ACC1C6L3_9ROSI|nr:hypothetical protein Patl1_00759 [Pistacia atlantica]
MASDESMNFVSSTQEEEYDDTDDGFYHQHQVPLNLSRLSMSKSSMYINEDEDDDNDERMRMSMTRLSIESFDGDADEEFSDDKDFKGLGELSSDSEKEPECYSLPATPPRRRSRSSIGQQFIGVQRLCK